MPRGRPSKSIIRANLVNLLYYMKKGYGYELAKAYNKIFPKVSIRVIYYNLKKGEKLGEFKVEEIVHTKGNYSWGTEAEKVIYALGENAKPEENLKLKTAVEELIQKKMEDQQQNQ